MGRQFMGSNYLDNDNWYPYSIDNNYGLSKVTEMIDYANEIKKNDELVWIGYVDDNPSDRVYDGSIDYKLNNEIPFHFFKIGAHYNNTGLKYTEIEEKGIEGVNEGLSFFIDPSLVRKKDNELIDEENRKRQREEVEKATDIENISEEAYQKIYKSNNKFNDTYPEEEISFLP